MRIAAYISLPKSR